MTQNSCTLAGYLGNTPELRYTGNSVPVTNMRLGQSYVYHDAQKKEQRKTNWFTFVAYGPVAEIAKGFQKGDNIVLEGSLETREWEAGDGSKRKVFEVVAKNIGKLERSGDRNGTPVEADLKEEHHDASWPIR